MTGKKKGVVVGCDVRQPWHELVASFSRQEGAEAQSEQEKAKVITHEAKKSLLLQFEIYGANQPEKGENTIDRLPTRTLN